MTRAVMWNYDKPHRCPNCHRIWVYQDDMDLTGVRPRWWKTYTCQHCHTSFTGRKALGQVTWIRMSGRICRALRRARG